MTNSSQQRSRQQELFTEDRMFEGTFMLAGLRHPNRENLLRVVPFVDGALRVETLIALQTDEFGVERERHHFRPVSFSDASLAFQQDWFVELRREHHGECEWAIGDVILTGESLLHS